jgi:hypothetical protein
VRKMAATQWVPNGQTCMETLLCSLLP